MIRTYEVKECISCGQRGEVLYEGLKDKLFDVQGSWTLYVCKNQKCGLVWLNPMPVEEDLGIAYAKYYTHSDREGSGGVFKKILEFIIRSYVDRKYGYKENRTVLAWIASYAIYLEPGLRALADARACHMIKGTYTDLLEVGCGSGKSLQYLKSLGWNVTGIDFDGEAVKAASGLGLDVYAGDIESQNYVEGSFDVVMSKHVIEHVPSPQSTFASFYNCLRAGGSIIIYTPNVDSLGHQIFQNNWRGLEPPRHLHIFNQKSLQRMLKQAGFVDIEVSTTYAGAPILLASLGFLLKPVNTVKIIRLPLLFLLHYVEWVIVKLGRSLGEELIVTAKKPL